MSLRRCIPELQQNGQLNREQAERLGGLYDELEKDYSTKFGQEAAAAMASEEAVRRFEAEAFQRKRQAALQVTVQQRISADVRKFKGDNPGAAAVALFTHDSKAPYSNIERRADIIEGQAHAMANGILEKFSRNAAGQVRNRAELHNVVREAFGEHTGDESAKELAKAWGDAAEMLRTRHNAAGGTIGKHENWGMPQVHNMRAVRSASFEQWRDFIRPLLDITKMTDQDTGLPMTPGKLEMALRGVYDTISSDGWNTRQAGKMGGSGKLANRRADSRFLAFRDADSWMNYSRRFGRPLTRMGEAIDPDGPIFDAMMGHLRGMSSDIAQMEILGPNPGATVKWIKDGLMIEAMQPKHIGTKRMQAAERAQHHVDNLFAEVSGANRGLDNTLKTVFGAVRSWQSASKLGGAAITAVTDVGFQHVTRRFNGIPAANALVGYAKMLKPGSAKDHALARRLWIVSMEASQMMSAHSRWTGEAMTGELASRLATGVMRVTGLGAWTEAGRFAFGHEFWSHITDQSTNKWSSINTPFRRQLERYGFNESDWDQIRSTPLEEANGAHWLLPENIGNRQLAERLAEMIATETDYAVPQASVRVTAATNKALTRGTWAGEIGRSMLLFKSFPITVMLMHGKRMIEEEGAYNKLKYAAALGISTTLMGAVSLQLHMLLAGKDPQDMDPQNNPAFWGKAMAQGGGIGIMGDFINSATSRFDSDIYSTLAGPMAGDIVQAQHVFSRTNHAKELQKLIVANTPGSSIWYTRLAFQREMLDQLSKMHDPDYYSSFGKMEQRAQQDHTNYWWRPGEQAPDRAPDAANAAR
jgi:hypothetical protein